MTIHDKLPFVEAKNGPQAWTPPRVEPGARYVILVKDAGQWRVQRLDPAPDEKLPPNGERLLIVPAGTTHFRVEPAFDDGTLRAGTNLFACEGAASPKTESYTPCDSAFAKNYFFGDGWIGAIKSVDGAEIATAVREANVLDALAQNPPATPVNTTGMDPVKAALIERMKQIQPKSPDDPEIQAQEAKAWEELKATPKRVTAAKGVISYYNGFMASIGAAARGEPNPPPPSVEQRAMADQWQQRVDEACHDPSTIDCGSELVLDERGFPVDLRIIEGPNGAGMAQPFTVSVQPPDTPRFLRRQREVSAIAGICGVSGLGFGASQPAKSFDVRRTTVTWPALKERYRALKHEEPTLIIDCPLAVTLPKNPRPGQPVVWVSDGPGKLLVRGKELTATNLMLRVEAGWLAVLATIPADSDGKARPAAPAAKKSAAK